MPGGARRLHRLAPRPPARQIAVVSAMLPPLPVHLVMHPPQEHAESDDALIVRMSAGDESALGALYDRFGTLAYSLAMAMLQEAADAEEVIGDAFAQLWRTAGTFDPTRGSVQAWVVTVTRSRALDRLRSRARAASAAATLERAAPADAQQLVAQPDARPDDATEGADLQARLRALLAELPAAQRRVVELAYFEGLSQSEIAARLDEPLGTIKTRARSALHQLREALAPLRARGSV
jgi:RNA polymerase sigma-70 factor, ECF subfamily